MKKYSRILLTVFFSSGILFGCKKDKTDKVPEPKDYSISVANKTWWGDFAYTGKPVEYYSVHFNEDKTFVWSQFAGDYAGHWAISGNKLTMKFDISTVEVSATITEDEKLSAISDNTGAYEVKTGQLIKNPNIKLDNTEWQGSLIFAAGVYHGYILSFLPAFYVLVLDGGQTYTDKNYTRSSTGAVIRASFKPPSAGGLNIENFGIIISDTEMVGSQGRTDITWHAIKK